MPDFEERRSKNRLTDDEIQWLRDEIADEKARSRLALKVRNFLTLVMLVIAAYTMFYDNIKSFVQSVTKAH